MNCPYCHLPAEFDKKDDDYFCDDCNWRESDDDVSWDPYYDDDYYDWSD